MRASLATIEVPVATRISSGAVAALAASVALLALELLGILHGVHAILSR